MHCCGKVLANKSREHRIGHFQEEEKLRKAEIEGRTTNNKQQTMEAQKYTPETTIDSDTVSTTSSGTKGRRSFTRIGKVFRRKAKSESSSRRSPQKELRRDLNYYHEDSPDYELNQQMW
eukprot:CAMPEP_0184743266 /NCGR_PEP_ID=MMETSP0315-20130426/6136_1 /TAXON_ID=101924 /ORGANISM="Rhodosorus marinus, Strain UTEX LB 2760" /LENGTH=118 /DNA_ID=CAMNT_0027214435 /DNA_START=51 /DNA_END=404 /DNA_ORIENTATION=+